MTTSISGNDIMGVVSNQENYQEVRCTICQKSSLILMNYTKLIHIN